MPTAPKWPGDRAPEIERAKYWFDLQTQWVEEHGRTRQGYIGRYHVNSFYTEPEAVAIFDADKAALDRAEQRYMRAVEKWSKGRRRS